MCIYVVIKVKVIKIITCRLWKSDVIFSFTRVVNVIFCRFLQATVAGVNPSQPPCVQISAVRAVSEYCSHLSSTDRTHVLQPFIGSMVDGLLSIMMQFSTDVIALCLETLCVVLEVL